MCDCKPGQFQCKQAMYLWSEVNRLFQSGLYPGDPEYDRASKAYQEHEREARDVSQTKATQKT